MLVKFTNPAVEQDASRGTPREAVYRPGRIYDLPDDQARTWIGRGCAVAAPGGSEPSPAEATTTAKVRFTNPAREGDACFEPGKVYELPADQAAAWISRGCAVVPEPEPEKGKKAKVAA